MESTVLRKDKESVMQEAHRLVRGERNNDYGHPLDDFSRTADMLTGLFRGKLKGGCHFTPRDVGLLMICVKLSREMNKAKRDNIVDICGYAGTVEMVYDEQKRRAALEDGQFVTVEAAHVQ